MKAVTHLEKVITGEVSAVTHLEKVIAGEASAVTYTEKVIAGEATPITHLQKVIAGIASPVTHLEQVWAGGSPTPSEHEYTGAVPVTIPTDGTPLLDFLISGNEEHAGTPSSDNPIMPQGTGERTGNLFDINATPTKYSQSTTVTVDGRTLTILGSWYIYYEIDVTPNTDYYVAWIIDYTEIEDRGTIAILTTSGQTIHQQSSTPFSFNSGENQCIRFTIYSSSNTPATVILSNIMLNTGSTALPYEPYGYKIPISSANTTTPVYLGEVQTTRKIKKLVLTGGENWQVNASNNVFYANISGALLTAENVITSCCSHYVAYGNQSLYLNLPDKHSCIRTSYSAVWIKDTDIATVEDFVTYLQQQYAAGTPVTVWYVLANETTGIVNEPLMKIGDYADTLSMEQAGVQIPTLNGQTVIDVDTALKPSEMYIKYKG